MRNSQVKKLRRTARKYATIDGKVPADIYDVLKHTGKPMVGTQYQVVLKPTHVQAITRELKRKVKSMPWTERFEFINGFRRVDLGTLQAAQ